jgi:hypothetical protein
MDIDDTSDGITRMPVDSQGNEQPPPPEEPEPEEPPEEPEEEEHDKSFIVRNGLKKRKKK